MVLDNEWLFILPRKPCLAKVLATTLKAPFGSECGGASNERTKGCICLEGRLYSLRQRSRARSARPTG